MDIVECPYCKEDVELNHDDGAHYNENEMEQERCEGCDKYFMVSGSVSWDYEGYKADCQNGTEHDYKITNTFPIKYSRMCCSMCEEEREPTAEERKKYKLDE